MSKHISSTLICKESQDLARFKATRRGAGNTAHAGIKRRNTERSHLNNCLFTHYVSRRSNKEPRRKQVRQQRSLVSLKCISACETREKLCYFTSISMINGRKKGSVMSFMFMLLSQVLSLRWNSSRWWIFKWKILKYLF